MAKLVLIGDSIRMGYAPFVLEAIGDKHDIFHPEMNGGPTPRVLEHADEWITQQKADLVHINAGLHDMKRESADKHQMITGDEPVVTTLDQYRENLRKIVTLIKDSGAKPVLALTTPVLEDRQIAIGKNPKRRKLDVDQYNQVMREVADEMGVVINDLHAVVIEADQEKVMTRDGVHYTAEGSQKLADAVVNCIERELP